MASSNDATNAETLQERKLAAKLKQLEDLNAARIQQSLSRKLESEAAPSFESLDLFLKRFCESKEKICRRSDELFASPPSDISQRKFDLEEVGVQIGDVERLIAQNSYFLPPYEVRTAQNAVSELRQRLEKVTSELIPKKKFAFKCKTTKTSSVVREKDENEVKRNEGEVNAIEKKNLSAVANSAKAIFASPGFRNKEGVTLVKDLDACEGGEFELSDLVNCKVYIRGQLRALFVHRLRGCHVYAGPVTGSVLVEEVDDSLLMLASHQIRIHQTRNTDFYLRVRSRPIVEYVTSVRFAPYAVCYAGIQDELRASELADDSGMWAKVDDFRWLRAVQSPNWSVLSEEERLSALDISVLDAEQSSESAVKSDSV